MGLEEAKEARNEARDLLKDRLVDYVNMIATQRRKGWYNCPLCGSGTGNNGKKTPGFQIKKSKDRWECYACGEKGDIFDLIGKMEHITDYNELLKRACQLFGVEIQNHNKTEACTHEHTHKPTQKTADQDNKMQIDTSVEKQKEVKETKDMKEEKRPDYTAFYLAAHKNINMTDYAAKRGLTAKTIDRFCLGFVPEWRHPAVSLRVPTSPRLIVPTSKESYLARDIRPTEEIPEEAQPYAKQKVGSIHALNIEALETSELPVYIVEGEIDALSIIEAGFEAVGIGSSNQWETFGNHVRQHKPKPTLILAFDRDAVGERDQENLANILTEAQIDFYEYCPFLGHKDANEALVSEGVEAFKLELQRGIDRKDEAVEAEKEAYINQNSVLSHIAEFLNGVKASADTPPTLTGFPELDKCMEGGLYEGLYAIGALPSLGKTTLCMQIADQIAKAGKDVLVFSLEMGRAELMAKSISRHTLELVAERGLDVGLAKSTRGITTGVRYKYYSPEEKRLINDAVLAYKEYADHLYIIEATGKMSVEAVREAVDRHIRITKNKSFVVVIDYLQILAGTDTRNGDKQNVDDNITALRQLARDKKLPIITISSVNRANYSLPINMSAFKESGGIEFSCDVVIGLQLKGVGRDGFNVDKEKRKNPREIELVILKNRLAPTGDKIYFEYYPAYNYYVETGKEEQKGSSFHLPDKLPNQPKTGAAAEDNLDIIDQLRGEDPIF